MLLVRLGLRTGEVAELGVDDMVLTSASTVISAAPRSTQEALPGPQDTRDGLTFQNRQTSLNNANEVTTTTGLLRTFLIINDALQHSHPHSQ